MVPYFSDVNLSLLSVHMVNTDHVKLGQENDYFVTGPYPWKPLQEIKLRAWRQEQRQGSQWNKSSWLVVHELLNLISNRTQKYLSRSGTRPYTSIIN